MIAYACSAAFEAASEFLLELKVSIVPRADGIESWDIWYACKCRGPQQASWNFLRVAEMDALFGSKELEADSSVTEIANILFFI